MAPVVPALAFTSIQGIKQIKKEEEKKYIPALMLTSIQGIKQIKKKKKNIYLR